MLPETFTYWWRNTLPKCHYCSAVMTSENVYAAYGFYCNETRKPQIFHEGCLSVHSVEEDLCRMIRSHLTILVAWTGILSLLLGLVAILS